jgi:hypothetical protein
MEEEKHVSGMYVAQLVLKKMWLIRNYIADFFTVHRPLAFCKRSDVALATALPCFTFYHLEGTNFIATPKSVMSS